MIRNLFLALLLSVPLISFAQLNLELRGQVEYNEDGNDIWGWVNADSTMEVAIMGLRTSVSIVDITDPDNPVEKGRIEGPSTTWRDIKTWGNYAFVTHDGVDRNGPTAGLLVINLGNLPDTITEDDWYYWAPELESPTGTGELGACHNIYIDEFGYAYLAGCSLNGGGMIYLDVRDGANVQLAGYAPSIYAHDVYVRDNKMYSSEIYRGRMAIYDVSDKQATAPLLGSTLTPFEFTHNIWLSDDGNVAFTTDEEPGAPVAAYDVSDPSNIEELDQFKPLLTIDENVVPHNVHVWDDWLIISYYSDGCIIADAARPHNIIEVGNFDTFIGGGGDFDGMWGAYPFFPSRTVIGSDIYNGLYVFTPTYVRACYLEGTVTDSLTKEPILGADVQIQSNDLNQSTTDLRGAYATGQVTSGTFNVVYSKSGYATKTVSASLQNGELTMVDVELVPLRKYDVVVEVKDGNTGISIEGAEVMITDGESDFTGTTDFNGLTSIPQVFEGNLDVYAGSWGYRYGSRPATRIDGNNTIIIELFPGYEDNFLLDLGWEVEANAETGNWERVIPVGTFSQGFPVGTHEDIAGDLGEYCYITQSGGSTFGETDVDNGVTRLISPLMDLSVVEDPVMEFFPWFVNASGRTQPNDSLKIFVSNGTDTVLAALITGAEFGWRPQMRIALDTVIAITDEMQVVFETADEEFDMEGHVVEAGVDDFRISGMYPVITSTEEIGREGLLSVAPNPFLENVLISYDLPVGGTEVLLELLDIGGRKVWERQVSQSQGTIELSTSYLGAGVYILRLSSGDEVMTRKLIKGQ